MARILGLDIGARSVKALLLETNMRGFAVRAFTEAKIEEESGLKGALATLQAGKHLAADQVVVAVPGLALATQLLTMPFTDARRIDATIAFEVEGQLPYDLDDVVFDYQVLAQHDGKSEVLVATVRKDELEKLLATLTEAGVDPRVVTTSALVYQNLLVAGLTGQAGPAPLEGVEAVIDIGHERTAVCIGQPKVGIEYARTFAGGGRDLTRAVAAEFKVTPADAETWKENEGDLTLGENTPPEMERAAGALMRGLAPVLREIRATVRAHYARFKKPLARIYLAGGTSKLKGLEAYLARELGVEVQRLDAIPRDGSGTVPAGAEPLAAQSFALSIRGAGLARTARLNLRKGPYAFKGDLDYLKGKTSRLAAFAAILVVLALVSVWAQYRTLSKHEGALDKVLCDTTTRVLGQCQKDYLVALSLLKGKGSPAAALPAVSALDLFAELTTRTQKAKVKLDEVEVLLDRIKMRGETESFDGVDQLVGVLKDYKCFQDIKRGKVQKTRDGSKVQFDLDIRVQCSEGGTQHQEGA